jgi:hypothetical protein
LKTLKPLLAMLLFASVPALVRAQVYRNVINTRFGTVASGPMQASIVDVPDPRSAPAVRSAVAAAVNAARAARADSVRRQVAMVRRLWRYRGQMTPGVADIVIMRQSGRLVLPAVHRTRAANDLTFVFPDAGAPGSWTAAQQQDLQTIINIIYPELRNVYGEPSWTGTVTVLNGDNMPAGQLIGDPEALSGGVYNATTNEITFAVHPSVQTRVLNFTQMMALAFHGPASIPYDGIERGMARAATLMTVRNVLTLIRAQVGDMTVADPLWHALDRYELLNQPPLGNDRFMPVSKAKGEANSSAFPRMLIPRLMMSGSAWLKVTTDDPSFLRSFNTAYYQALGSSPDLKNSVPELKRIAQQALTTDGTPAVEGMAFADWYARQYVLDTSVSPGTKLYAWFFAASRPDPGQDDYSVAVVLEHYVTTFDTQGNSDEVSVNGTSYPIYWDYNFSTRLFLGAQYERVDLGVAAAGEGSVAPTFFDTIGGDPGLSGRMRIAIDFPLNFQNVRLYVAPRSMGTLDVPSTFWGVVVGADTGKIRIEADGISSGDVQVAQGAFGAVVDPNLFSQPRRATITFTDASGGQTVRRVNTGYGEYIAVFHVTDPVDSRTHSLPGGPAMISFPIQPLQPKAADALLDPTTGQPLFNEGNLLLAQWRQNLPGDDKYARYPTLDPLQPGKGYWSNFDTTIAAKLVGRVPAVDADVSLGLLFGWNQIGNPWKGYWIRVLVSEGVTVTYPNPSGSSPAGRLARASRAVTAPRSSDGWGMPITVRGPGGFGATAYIGQTSQASAGYDAQTDALRPPDFTRSSPSIAFAHPDWGAHAGDYFSDIRRTGAPAQWNLTVYAPGPSQTYTLSWSSLAAVPRSVRLVLTDLATGRRQYLQGTSSYSFVPGSTPTRSFRISTEDRSRGALRISSMVVRTTRASGGRAVEIGYDLSQGATVTAEIRGMDGRPIRQLGAGRAAPAGENRVMWDTRDERGIMVPSGAYLVQVTARTPEGDLARMVQPVTIVR